MLPSIRLDIHAPIAELILNKPEKRNALGIDMWAAVPELIAQAEASDQVKAVIVHGGDAGAFAAGADISEFGTVYATEAGAAEAGATISRALNAIETCAKPVIAAIEGACVGAGVSVAMAADIRLASSSSKFGVTPAKLGLVYPFGDTRRLLEAVGPSATKDILFTGRIFTAEEAKSFHLIDRLVEAGEALPAARALAEEMSGLSQWSLRSIKKMIAGVQSGWTETSPEAQALFLEGFANEDFQEGHRAFLEKRRAAFPLK